VSDSLCVSCGICVGSCPSSTPFRRTADLKTGIDLPDYSLKELRERVVTAAQTLHGTNRVLTLACEHGGGAAHVGGLVALPCVAMAPPSLIDFILSKNLADGVVIAGCAESACFHRMGVTWTQQRVAQQRDPYLRARVPRERLATIWVSALETRRFEAELAAFAQRLERLPPLRLRSPLPASAAAPSQAARPEPVTERGPA
jgi:coenzyme F420-reducing hydrogenase delta subunit